MPALRSNSIGWMAAVVVSLGAATAATAEGLPRGKEPAYYARPSIWQGLYGGVHLGHADADGDDGLMGGVQLGYNWQTGQIVYGLEGDVSVTDSDTIDLLASARGRLGYLLFPNLLVYGTAGVGLVSGDDTEAGFVYGLGVEGAFTDSMTARLEYLSYDSDFNSADVLRVGLNLKLGR